MSRARSFVVAFVLAAALAGAGTAGAYHTHFVADNCNYNPPQPTSYITREGSTTVALRARHEGYQWAGGCWNDNDRDDSPNDPHEDANTGGEGPDCSGFTFKVWREALSTGDASFDQWGMLRSVHGPYTAAAFKAGPGRRTSQCPSPRSSRWTHSRATVTSASSTPRTRTARIRSSRRRARRTGRTSGRGRTAVARATRPSDGSAGAESGSCMVRAVLLLVCSLATPGCHEDAHPPTRLLDGRAAKVLPVSLEGVSGTAIETEVHAVTRDRFAHNRAVASCEGFEANGARGPAIVRVGATGRSVTLRVANGHAFLACDGTHPGSVARWCGRAYARLRRGRLPDPRLDLTCTGRSGPIAFGWIEPGKAGEIRCCRATRIHRGIRGRGECPGPRRVRRRRRRALGRHVSRLGARSARPASSALPRRDDRRRLGARGGRELDDEVAPPPSVAATASRPP